MSRWFGAAHGHFLSAVASGPDRFVLLFGSPEAALATEAFLAGDSAGRRHGLLGREGLGSGEALVLAPCEGIHTFGLRFAIDAVFVDRSGRVLRIDSDVPPRRIRVAWRAFAVVELAAGSCRSARLSVGDRLTARPGVPEARQAASGREPTSLGAGALKSGGQHPKA